MYSIVWWILWEIFLALLDVVVLHQTKQIQDQIQDHQARCQVVSWSRWHGSVYTYLDPRSRCHPVVHIHTYEGASTNAIWLQSPCFSTRYIIKVPTWIKLQWSTEHLPSLPDRDREKFRCEFYLLPHLASLPGRQRANQLLIYIYIFCLSRAIHTETEIAGGTHQCQCQCQA